MKKNLTKTASILRFDKGLMEDKAGLTKVITDHTRLFPSFRPVIFQFFEQDRDNLMKNKVSLVIEYLQENVN